MLPKMGVTSIHPGVWQLDGGWDDKILRTLSAGPGTGRCAASNADLCGTELDGFEMPIDAITKGADAPDLGYAYYMHKFAFIIRAKTQSKAFKTIDDLAASQLMLGCAGRYDVMSIRMGFECAELFGEDNDEDDGSDSSPLDCYYATTPPLNTRVDPDAALPVTMRAPCVLNYLFLFTGLLRFHTPASPFWFGLTDMPDRLFRRVTVGSVRISLKPHVVRRVSESLCLRPGRVASPVFQTQRTAVEVTPGAHTVRVDLPFAFPAVAFLVELISAANVIPRIAAISFEANNNPSWGFQVDDSRVLSSCYLQHRASVFFLVSDGRQTTGDIPAIRRDVFMHRALLQRESIDMSRLMRATMVVVLDWDDIDIDMPLPDDIRIEVTALTANVMIREGEYCSHAFGC